MDSNEIVTHMARILKGVVSAEEKVSEIMVRLRLDPSKPFVFSPGRFVSLQFTPELVRPYSIANISGEGYLEFLIQIEKQGQASSYIENELKLGKQIKMRGPLGVSYLRKKHQGSTLIACAGAGLGPTLSILRGMINEGMRHPVELYIAANGEKDLCLKDTLGEIEKAYPDIRVIIALASESPSAKVSTENSDNFSFYVGSVIEAIAGSNHDLSEWNAYVFGAPTMTEATTFQLKRKGLPSDQLFVDAFYPNDA